MKHIRNIYIRFEVLTVLQIHNVIFCVIRWHSPVGGYQYSMAHSTQWTI